MRKLTQKEVLTKFKAKHGRRYDYSKVVYVSSKTLVIITCKEHGEFPQTPNDHLSGKGCAECSGLVRLTKERFLLKCREVHGKRYDYSKVAYTNNRTKVTIICSIHGDFSQTPHDHMSGYGCFDCGVLQRAASKTKSTEKFIREAIYKHQSKYDYSNVVYRGTRVKVIIGCQKHGDFPQTPNRHLAGDGCSKCGDERTAASRRLTREDFIRRAAELHGGSYDYSKVVYFGNATEVTIGCPHHGDFQQTPHNHLAGRGCQKCGGPGKLTQEEFLIACHSKHGVRYDYSRANYINDATKVTIGCPQHRFFEQAPADHLNGHGCPDCAGVRTPTRDEFLAKCILVHGDLYRYTRVLYLNNRTEVLITCQRHGDFSQTPHAHLSGQGCPRCGAHQCKQEREWLDSLGIPDRAGDTRQYRVPGTCYTADGYNSETNTLYEYNGTYYHGDPRSNRWAPDMMNKKVKKTFGELYQEWGKKKQTLLSLGYKLVVMWEIDFKEQQRLTKKAA